MSRWPAMTTRSERPRWVRATTVLPWRRTSRCGSRLRASWTASASGASVPETLRAFTRARANSAGLTTSGPVNGGRATVADWPENGFGEVGEVMPRGYWRPEHTGPPMAGPSVQVGRLPGAGPPRRALGLLTPGPHHTGTSHFSKMTSNYNSNLVRNYLFHARSENISPGFFLCLETPVRRVIVSASRTFSAVPSPI